MRQRISKFLMVVLLVTAGFSFFGGEVNAVDFTTLGFQVTHTCFEASDTEASYVYKFHGTTTNTISNIDLPVPSNINLASGNLFVLYSVDGNTYSNASYELFAPGVGDSGTKFLTGDINNWVLKVNSTSRSFPLDFYIKFIIKNQVPPIINNIHYKLSFKLAEMLIKSGNGSVWETKPIDGPAFVPKKPTVAISADPNPINYPTTCTTLTWTSTDATWVIISDVGLVTPVSGGTTSVCPEDPKQYRIDAVGDGGYDTKYVTVNLGTRPPPPIPSIEVSRETIEKRDNTGTVIGYSTFYYQNGLLTCSYQTDLFELIPQYPCSDGNLCDWTNIPSTKPKCDIATNTIASPLVTCIPFPGWAGGMEDLATKCGSEVNCFAVNLICKQSNGTPYTCPALCKPGQEITHSSTEQIGNNTCCLKKEPCSTGGTGGYCYTKVPCAGTSTCP